MNALDRKVENALYKAIVIFRLSAPIKTGNLRYNAIKMQRVSEGVWRVFIDETIAPYAKYTILPWRQKPIKMGNFKKRQTVIRQRTWRNPNEGWWDKAARSFAINLNQILQGELKTAWKI